MSSGFPVEVHAQLESRCGGRCEVCGEGRVTEHHHRRPRGRGGTRREAANLASNGLAVCHPCHRMIESHRAVALLLGWLVRSTAAPTRVPVMYRGTWMHLTDTGTVDGARC